MPMGAFTAADGTTADDAASPADGSDDSAPAPDSPHRLARHIVDQLETSLDGIPDDLTLDDIFDREEAQQIQDAFSQATGVASIITYPDGRPFTRPSNFTRLCADIIRKTELGLCNCMQSDAMLGRANAEGPVIQPCLSGGLVDGGTSIVIGDRHIGNWLIGQVLSGPVDLDRMMDYARLIGADEADYRHALDDVTRMPPENFERIARALCLIARQLSTTGLKTLMLARQIEKLNVAERQLKRLALFDVLTGLPNRALGGDRLKVAIEQAGREGQGVALLFIDLDDFKQVNDTRGHLVGDALLREAAERLRACCRGADTVARLGGDEFLIVLPMLESPVGAEVLARKAIASMAEPFTLDGHRHFVTASVGIALYPDDGIDCERLLLCADMAMYRAKESGRNDYRRFTPEMNTRARRRASLAESLRLALENGEFALHYQPIHSLGRGGPTGAEALLRWRHPELGSCPPAEYIPLAEETGLIVPIGAWVLE